MKERLFYFLESANPRFQKAPLPDEVKSIILQQMRFQKFYKHQLLVEEGTINNKLYFLIKGIVRWYYHDERGRQITDFFQRENSLVGLGQSFYHQQPGTINVQALEDCETLVLTYEQLEAIADSSHVFERVIRMITHEHAFIWHRLYRDLRGGTVFERYRQLIRDFPEILPRVPLKDIASYLKTTPQNLSKIRKRKAEL